MAGDVGLAVAFGAGVASFLSPCVLPLIPSYITFITGMTLDDVVLRSTWHPACEIKREELGNLSVGAPADVAVLRVEKGSFGFVDINGARMKGAQKLVCEMTVHNGKVVHDLNIGRSAEETLRVIQALQTGGLCQAEWRPGQETIKT